MNRQALYRNCSNRCMAGAIALIALLMQGLAGYLPMPAMGGMTSWDAAWLPLCQAPQRGDRGSPPDPAHDPHCTACMVVQQASTTMAPAETVLSVQQIATRLARDETRDMQVSGVSARTFSSRAPPIIA